MADEEEVVQEYTTAEQWPTDDGGEDLVLPSGAKVRVAAPPVLWMSMSGQIPAWLQAIAKRHQADKKSYSSAETKQMLDWLIAESFISERVSVTRKPGYMHISKISDRDKEFIAMHLRLQTYASALK